jgi:ABC-type bacteriocin/lantibiotic exporter with double-glycine peptidase domain
MQEKRNANGILVEKYEGNEPLARANSRPRWEDNINTNLAKVRRKGVDSIHLVQHRGTWRAFVNTEMNLCVPYSEGNFLTR